MTTDEQPESRKTWTGLPPMVPVTTGKFGDWPALSVGTLQRQSTSTSSSKIIAPHVCLSVPAGMTLHSLQAGILCILQTNEATTHVGLSSIAAALSCGLDRQSRAM